MGKMPLAGLIGACGLGILLTGCNCCNKRPAYAGGRAESSMGVFGQHQKNQSTTVPAPIDDTSGKSLGSPSSTVSPQDFVPRGSSAGSSRASNAGMTTPSSSGNMTPMSDTPPVKPNTIGQDTNSIGQDTLSKPANNSNAISMTPSGTGSNGSSSPAIQQISHRSDADNATADADGTPYFPSKGPSRVIPPPPPTANSYTTPPPSGKTSSSSTTTTTTTATKNATSGKSSKPALQSSSPLSPPSSPSSDNTSLLNDPPPSVNMKSTSSTSGSGASPPTNSTSLMLPSSVNMNSTSSTSGPGASPPTTSTSLMLPGYMK
jgi:hypothetical protein